MRLLGPRHVGLLYGTDKTFVQYLPPEKWDRGVMHKFNGKGFRGLVLKLFGRWIVKFRGLSPVWLYKETTFGDKQEHDGIISYVLRKHKDFYEQGVKILIIDISSDVEAQNVGTYSKVSLLSYNGNQFLPLDNLKVNNAIIKQFSSKNFVSAYVPDYGAIVFNTIKENYLERSGDHFKNESDLKKRLDTLISAIEMASLAHLGRARGKQTAHIIWHKEKNLRRTAFQLKQKEIELEVQRKYLKAVGAVNEKQLNMDAVNIPDGVYAFMDMVGSATIRKNFTPRDYFFILNLCHQVAADCANQFACRVDNFIGDCVFLQTASPFDSANRISVSDLEERLMLMTFALSSMINQIHMLKTGRHLLDESGITKKLMTQSQVNISYRAGMEIGAAMIGPLGSKQRKIVTAIGKSVNNASRLESLGLQEQIHISDATMQILKNAYISKDTPLIWSILHDCLNIKEERFNRGIRFFDAYQKYFNITEPLISEQKDVSYKEFSSSLTYLIKCIPNN